MSAIKEAMEAMRNVLLVNDKIERTGNILTELAKEVREHDRRLIRLETLVEVAKTHQSALPENHEQPR